MESNKRETFRQSMYALASGLVMVALTYLTLITLTVYAKQEPVYEMDLSPLLTPPTPLGNEGVSPVDPDLLVFSEVNIFEEIVTPIPTETKIPKATPTPTERPIAQHWKLTMVSDGFIAFTDFTKQTIILSVGEEHQGNRVKEIRVNEGEAVIEDILDFRTRVLSMSSGG